MFPFRIGMVPPLAAAPARQPVPLALESVTFRHLPPVTNRHARRERHIRATSPSQATEPRLPRTRHALEPAPMGTSPRVGG